MGGPDVIVDGGGIDGSGLGGVWDWIIGALELLRLRRAASWLRFHLAKRACDRWLRSRR